MTPRSRSSVLILAAAILAVGTSAAAQSEPPAMVVERPSVSTPPNVVGQGFWQIESGLAWQRDSVSGDDRSTFTAPNSTLRLGVNDRLELRASVVGFISQDLARGRSTSASDLALGVKYQLASQEGFGLDISVVPMISIPTGGIASSGNVDPSVVLTAARHMGASTLNANVVWAAPSVGDAASDRLQTMDFTLVLSRPLWGRWSAFWEGVATDVEAADERLRWRGNVGLGRTIGQNIELDAYVGKGLNDAATDWAFGVGMAWRFRR